MNTNDTSAASCCACCKEIPLDAALTPEGTESEEPNRECESSPRPGSSPASTTEAYPDIEEDHANCLCCPTRMSFATPPIGLVCGSATGFEPLCEA